MRSVFFALLLPALAYAETAQDHFSHGVALYEATRYEAALREFEAAQAIEPMAAFVFNIARCLDRLERSQEARAAYARFVAENPEAPTAPVARERISVLSTMEVTTAPKPPARRRWLVPVTLGASAITLLAVGGGLLGSAVTDYKGLETSCAPLCPTSSWSGIRSREIAGEVFLGLGAATVVADIVTIAIEYGRRK